jgi:hypothetical protein
MGEIRPDPERRAAYRVVAPSPTDLDLTLTLDDTAYRPTQVGDVSANGISLRFNPEHSIPLRRDARVELRFVSPRLPITAQVAARVVYSAAGAHGQSVRLEFDDDGRFAETLSAPAFELFNRRAVMRGVTPAHGTELDARLLPDALEGLQAEVPALVQNLSTMGIALIADPRADAFLLANPRFVLSLKLPSAPDRFLITAHCRHRAEDAGRLLYGCAFNWQDTPGAFGIIGALTEYMLDRFESLANAARH